MKRILILMVTLVLSLSATASVFAAKTPATIACDGKLNKSVAVDINATQNNTRKNASGAKITSNAHSADFPGIYFIWDSKQKDNGYLMVEASVFAKYESFVLTSKESNTFWDFPIALQAGQKTTAEGCYVFYIPKVYNNKNINMVFISEFKEKEPEPFDFSVTVFHRVVDTGAYLVYPGIGETFSSTQEEYIEWLNDTEGFTFLNLYLAAIRNNDPASMSSVEGHTCVFVTKDDENDMSFNLNQKFEGADIEALVTPVAEGHYVLTFWYEADKPEVVVSYERYRAYVKLWNDIFLEVGGHGTVVGDYLANNGGAAHYNALLVYFGASSLPNYWHFDASMKDIYDYWADQLEVGLLYVHTLDELHEYAKNFNI